MSKKTDLKNTNQKTSFKYIYNTRKYLVWSGVFALITTALLFVSIIPQFNSISKLYSNLIRENKRLAQLKIKVAQLTDSRNSLIVTNSDKVNQALPSKKPLLELLTSLNNVGKESQVLFNDISLSPGKISTQSAVATSTRKKNSKNSLPTTKYDTLHLDLSISGKISNINDFLIKIENIAPFTTVTAMSLNEKTNTSVDDSFSKNTFEAKLTISTYFFTRSVSTNIDAALPELTVVQREIIDQLQNFTYSTIEEQYLIQGGGLENLFPGVGAIPI